MHLPGEPVDPSTGASEAQSDDLRRNSHEQELDAAQPSLKSTYNPDDKTALSDIAAIRKQLAAGNLEQAAFRASLALLSFPGHPALRELESEIQQRVEREEELRRMTVDAEQYRESRKWSMAVERYESALQLDPGSKSARAHLAQVYADWARDLLPDDPGAAERLVQKSLELDGDNADVRQLQLLLLQHATRDIVERAVIKARQLRARDELARPEAVEAENPGIERRTVEAPDAELERQVAEEPSPPTKKQTVNVDESTVIQPLRTRIEVGMVLAQRYKILGQLGAGGMGSVYKAQDLLIDQTIALKVVLPSVSGEPKLREKFKQEMLVARRLTHPNVVRIYDIGEHRELLFISMELIEGQTVADILVERKRFTVGQFLTLFNQFTSALAYIHSQHILHRDIKPQNLMYDRDGNLKVMDFGIARNMASEETTTSIVVGTPAYMSPELIEGAVLTPAADVYSAGAMFYELLTGVRVFADGSLRDRLNMTVPRASERVPNIPHELDDMIYRCLQYRPADRFQSVTELAAAVSSTQHADPAGAPGGTLADFIRDEPASVLDALPVFIRVVQKLSSIRQDPAVRPILTPQTIRWTQDAVEIETISADEAQNTRAVDCKYACFDDFNEATAGGSPRLESDIYVMGFMFYEILLGQRLFRTHFQELYKGNWNFQWLQWHSDPAAAAAPLKQVLSGCPPALSDAIESMMQKKIELRPDFAAVEAAFNSILEYAKRDLMKTVVIKRGPRKPEKARSAGRIAALLIFGALLAFAAWWFVQGGSLP